MQSRKRIPWEAAALLLAGVGALLFQRWLPTTLPSDADRDAMASELTARAQAGDVLLLQPWWTERARTFTPPALPVVGYLGSESDDLEDFSRIWVLSEPRLPYAGTSAFERAFLPGRTRIGEPVQRGAYQLALYANGRHRTVLFRASESTAAATAALSPPGGGARTECRHFGPGFACPKTGTIETGWHELFYRPMHCIELNPPGGAEAVTLSFPEVPAASALVLDTGIIWEHAAKHDPGMTPLEVELRAPGASFPLATLEIPVGKEGVQRVEAKSWPGGPVEISVRSTKREHRTACLELKAVGAR